MKVLHFANVAGLERGGGVHEVVYNFWTVQNNIGVDSDLWFPGKKDEEICLKEASSLHSAKSLRTFFNPNYGLVRDRRRIMREMSDFDIIHQHGIWLPISKLIKTAGKRFDIPVLIQPHGYLEPYGLAMSQKKKRITYKLYERENLERAKVIIACSIDERDELRKILPNKDIAVIENGVSNEFYNADSENKYFEHPKYNGKKNILFLSRIHPLKGLDRFIRVFSELPNKITKDWNVIISGIDECDHSAGVRNLALELKLENKVFFEGAKFGQEKIDIMSSADFFVLPTHNENYGIVVAESLARGVPVLTTKGAPWKLLEEEGCGFWAENSDAGLREKLQEALTLPPLKLREMGAIGRKIAAERFLWENIVEKTIELYSWVLNGGEVPAFVFLGDRNKRSVKLY